MATGEPTHEQLLQLLQICEDYFRHADPTTDQQLDTILHRHGITAGPSWLIDMLGFTHLRLQNPTHHGEPAHRNRPLTSARSAVPTSALQRVPRHG